MKLPVFEELKVPNFEIPILLKALHRIGAGQLPIFVYLSAKNEAEARQQLDHITKALHELGVHPQIPFPIYAITEFIDVHPDIPIVPNEEELPQHFNKKSKRLKTKEQSLLNRVRIVAEKLNNQDLIKTDDSIKMEMSLHRRLYRLTRETHFYETILKKLKQ